MGWSSWASARVAVKKSVSEHNATADTNIRIEDKGKVLQKLRLSFIIKCEKKKSIIFNNNC